MASSATLLYMWHRTDWVEHETHENRVMVMITVRVSVSVRVSVRIRVRVRVRVRIRVRVRVRVRVRGVRCTHAALSKPGFERRGVP